MSISSLLGRFLGAILEYPCKVACILISFFFFQENGDVTPEKLSIRSVKYPFSVNEKVVIKVTVPISAYDCSCLVCEHHVEGNIPSRVTGGHLISLLARKQ